MSPNSPLTTKSKASEMMPLGRGRDSACCGQANPNEDASCVPEYGSLATGRRNRRSPTLVTGR